MVPLRDDNPISSKPRVTIALIIINIFIFLFQINLEPNQLQAFWNTFAIVPIQLTASFRGQTEIPILEWMTLFTSQFLHGGFLHIGGNMLYLWVFGNNIEDQLGHVRFMIFYLGCGALAGLTQWVFAPLSDVPTIGASGAIAGVMGAYILRFPRAYILTLIPLIFFFFTIRGACPLFFRLLVCAAGPVWFAKPGRKRQCRLWRCGLLGPMPGGLYLALFWGQCWG